MTDVTQGTMIYGMRSRKYPNVLTYGMIVSASCDLAQAKVDKVYYLTAVTLMDWIFSEEGFKKILSPRINNLENNLHNKCIENELDWDVIKSFSNKEANVIIEEIFKNAKERNNIHSQFEKYKTYTTNELTYKEKKRIMEDEKNNISRFLTDVVNGKYMHYIFVPAYAFEWDKEIKHGMIIDLQELSYLRFEDVVKLCKGDIDEKVLEEDEKTKYDENFFILSAPGFSIPSGNLIPPWTEYVMQHFSNSFIRIGVDTLKKDEINTMINQIYE